MSADFAEREGLGGAVPRRDDRGFTLLEVVVAVAIAALALVALFQIGSTGLFAVDEATRADEAVERAQSHLAAYTGSGDFFSGKSEGDDGNGYHWRLNARPVASQPSSPTNGASATTLYDVEVVISWKSRGRERSVALETERIGSSAAPQ
jgi:general secretion pathway protein I